ncbi:MAG: lytic murein transglycosylase, partial [Pseudomonas marincola]
MPNLFFRGLSHTAIVSTMLLLGACSEAPAQPLAASTGVQQEKTTASPTITRAEEPTPQLSFSEWRDLLRSDAMAAGVSPQVFDRAFAGITPNPSVIRADSSQPEFSRPVWEYIEGAVSSQRVDQGRSLLAKERLTLDKIEQRYQVNRETLVAIWGMESNFGGNIGNFN